MTTPAKSFKTMATLPYSQETGRVIPLDEIDAKPAALKHQQSACRQPAGEILHITLLTLKKSFPPSQLPNIEFR